MVASVSRPTVQGSARPMTVITGVGNAESEGPKSPRTTRLQKAKYCSSSDPSVP